jgi:hypothetical protein
MSPRTVVPNIALGFPGQATSKSSYTTERSFKSEIMHFCSDYLGVGCRARASSKVLNGRRQGTRTITSMSEYSICKCIPHN